MRLVAGWLPPLAIIRHRGRRTGRALATPVTAFGAADGLVVGVLYGGISDWVRNVRVAGDAQVKRRRSSPPPVDMPLSAPNDPDRAVPPLSAAPSGRCSSISAL